MSNPWMNRKTSNPEARRLLRHFAGAIAALFLAAPLALHAEGTAAANQPDASQTAAQAPAATGDSTETLDAKEALPNSDSHQKAPAEELGDLQLSATVDLPKEPTNSVDQFKSVQQLLDEGRDFRRLKNFQAAEKNLTLVMETNAPLEFKRSALFELALVAQDQDQLVKAQQIFAQYLHKFANDPSVPEVLLRQGILFRKMGINELAVSKFYAVMSSALRLKLENIEYYKKLVLQAQLEIADTRYLDGKYDEAADLFGRMIRSGDAALNKPQVHYKLVRSLSFTTNTVETVGKAQSFLELYGDSPDVPEVRFLLASSLKKLGRNQDAMKQVLLLLQSQEDNARRNPEAWSYWQQRAGNEIASQLCKEGDYMSALQIYQSLAQLNTSPAWQMPVWYQCALMYEQLQQPTQAMDQYARIVERQKDLTPATTTPGLQSLVDMAKWRKGYIEWLQQAKISNEALKPALLKTNTQTAALTQ
jgi:tetratricopeptide (TPR) repeat protein